MFLLFPLSNHLVLGCCLRGLKWARSGIISLKLDSCEARRKPLDPLECVSHLAGLCSVFSITQTYLGGSHKCSSFSCVLSLLCKGPLFTVCQDPKVL